MRHVRLGQTDLQVSAVAFGTGAFGGDWSAVHPEGSRTAIHRPWSWASTCSTRRRATAYAPSFKLRLALKDLRPVTETAMRPGQDLMLAAASRNWLEQADQAGASDHDFSAVVATILAAASSPSGTNGVTAKQ
ncbi:MAG TPA: NAD-binding protein [Actinoplanes sp.]|nr:NAD-binding protein [Actinoplanes sp.]